MALKQTEEPRKVELVSLIDVVFLLLIFFIITTAMSQGKGVATAGKQEFTGRILPNIDLIEVPPNHQKSFLKPGKDQLLIMVKPKSDTGFSVFILSQTLWRANQIKQIIDQYHACMAAAGGCPPAISQGYHAHIISENVNLNQAGLLTTVISHIRDRINHSLINYRINTPKIDFVFAEQVSYRVFYRFLMEMDSLISQQVLNSNTIGFHVLVTSGQ